MMFHLVTLLLFFFLCLFPLLLSIAAQDASTSTVASSTADSGSGTGGDTGGDPSTTSTVTVSSSSSSSSTSAISNGTNTTVTPTAIPTKPTSGRAACPGNDAYTELLKNDLPPWNCPRLDVDGGALGERNNYDPCSHLTLRLEEQRAGNKSTDYVCTRAPVAGLNSSKPYSTVGSQAYSLPTLVTKGDVYPVAIVTSNVLFNKKMIFQPTVDSFTSLEIAASHGMQWFSVPNTFISLEAGGLTSGPRSRIFRIPGLNANDKETMAQNYWQNPTVPDIPWQGTHYGIVPFWTVLINVDNGRITNITWDEGCDACADQLCSPDGNCGVDEYSCALYDSTKTLTDGTIIRLSTNISTLPEYDIRTLSDCARDAAYNYGTNMTYNTTNYEHVRKIASECIAKRQVYSNTQVGNETYPATALSIKHAAQKRIQPQIPPTMGSVDCGIKIYLGWTGTDRNGKYFTSAGKRLSVFRKYSIGAAFNSASSYVNQQLPEAPQDPNTQ